MSFSVRSNSQISDTPSLTHSHTSTAVRARITQAVLLVIGIATIFAYAHRYADFDGYVGFGRAILDGKDSYVVAPPGVATYPPFFSFFCVPFAWLGRSSIYLARAMWVVLNELLLMVISWLLVRLIYLQPPSLGPGKQNLWVAAPAFYVPLWLTLPFLLNNFERLNLSVLIFALSLSGLYLAETKREIKGGALVGTAAALKVMPVAFILYFAYRRQWRRFLGASLSAGGLSLSPILMVGWSRFQRDVVLWLAETHALWNGGPWNQSVYAMWVRFVGPSPLATIYLYKVDGVYAAPTGTSAALLWSLSLLLVIACALWQFRSAPGTDRFKILCEWGAIFLLSVLFSPVMWKHYLTVLWLPCFLLVAAWRSGRLDPGQRRIVVGVLLFCAVTGALTYGDLFGGFVIVRVLTYSVVTIMALVVLGSLLWLRRSAPANLLP